MVSSPSDDHESSGPAAGADQDPPKARPAAREELKKGFKGMLRRDMVPNEQLAVYGGALIALVIGLSVSIPIFLEHHHAKNQASPGLYLGLTVIIFLAMAAAARYGRRTVAAVVSLLAAFGMGTVLGFIYIALGAWLMFRNSRAQREQRLAARGATRPGRESSPRERTTGRGASAAPSREARGGRSARRVRATPPRRAPNKRYTPPADRGRRR